MTEIVKIANYVELAKNRLLEQYKNKVNMESAVELFNSEKQEMETTLFDIRDKTIGIYESEGVQLDILGIIVGQPRLNFDDDFYRILILTRIGINISNGESERVINTAKLLTSANHVHYMNLKSGKMAVDTDGQINPLTIEFLLTNLNRTVLGATRVNYLTISDKTEAFALSGSNVIAPSLGFGDHDNLSIGGKLSELYTIKNKFSFDGNNTSDQGFGTSDDPYLGGVFVDE